MRAPSGHVGQGVQGDLGPALPSRAGVLAMSRELVVLARRAEEFAGTGPTRDLAAALKQFDRMRAILGPGA